VPTELLLQLFATHSLRERIGLPVALLLLLAFVAIGIDTVISPQRYMNGYLRRGGDLLREWNELGTQTAGLLLSAVLGWLLFELLRSVFR
jgi:hypothetical protein